MKSSVPMKSLRASFVLLAAGGIGHGALAAEDTYHVFPLRGLNPHDIVVVYHMNNMGEVHGETTDPDGMPHPTFWHHFYPKALDTAFGMYQAFGLNDRSELVGNDLQFNAVILRHNKLERLDPDHPGHAGTGRLNNRGEVAVSIDTDYLSEPVNYHFNGFKAVAVPGPGQHNVVGMTNSGAICGNGYTDKPFGFVRINGVTHVIGPPSPDQIAGVVDCNDHHEVLGNFLTYSGYHAFIWRDGVIQELNLGFPGEFPGPAWAINDSGVVVGQASGRAVIWHNGKTIDLANQIAADDPLKGRIGLYNAVDINDAGEILVQNGGSAVVLRPTRLPNINP